LPSGGRETTRRLRTPERTADHQQPSRPSDRGQRPGPRLHCAFHPSWSAAAPNQRWVGDTTEFVIGDGAKLYLAAISLQPW